MSTPSARIPTSYKGRILGVAILVAISVINGIIHVISGIVVMFANTIFTSLLPLQIPMSSFMLMSYGTYTFFYGLLSIVFAYGLWMSKRWGWIGTVAVQIFCLVVDVFAALRLPLLHGVPEFAGIVEIPWYIAILAYILQPHIRRTFLKPKS